MTEDNSKGIRYDDGKSRVDLVPPEAIFGMANVLSAGAEKYGERNWEKGMRWGRVYASAMRHMLDWWNGQDRDPESGHHHIAHALANLAFLASYEARGLGTDDRPCPRFGGCNCQPADVVQASAAYAENGPSLPDGPDVTENVPQSTPEPVYDERHPAFRAGYNAGLRVRAGAEEARDDLLRDAGRGILRDGPAPSVSPLAETELERGERLVKRWMMDVRTQDAKDLAGFKPPVEWNHRDGAAAHTYLVSIGARRG